MRILIVGAGALGGFYGGLLARSGADVTFLARGATLDRLRNGGLTVESNAFGSFTLPVSTSASIDELEAPDLIFFSVKAYDLEETARQIAPLVREGTTLLAVQNGIDHPQRLEAILGEGQVVPGVVYVSTTVPSPGMVVHVGGPGLLQIGEIAPRVEDRINALGAAFSAAGVPVEVTPDIWPRLWTKFAAICAMSGVSALTRLTLRQILDVPESRRLYQDVMAEVTRVALASGAAVPDDTADRLMTMLEQMPALPERGSMAYDLLAGRRLEIETLNGTVVRLGEAYGVPAPMNRAIYAALLPYRDGAPHATR
jgi:2-dehydropantoate 2-reductase